MGPRWHWLCSLRGHPLEDCLSYEVGDVMREKENRWVTSFVNLQCPCGENTSHLHTYKARAWLEVNRGIPHWPWPHAVLIESCRHCGWEDEQYEERMAFAIELFKRPSLCGAK